MPYPAVTPTSKHDLLSPRLPPSSTRLQESMGFDSTAALFQALNRKPPTDLKRIGAVYSYPDSPSQPLSRGLLVIGVADISLSVVRKLVGDEDDVPDDVMHKCTLAVKRADGHYASSLPEKDIVNSHAFANFLRRLKREGVVAILSQDKYQRFAILKPSQDMVSDDGDYQSYDFFGYCYVGQVEAVKEYIAQGLTAMAAQPTPASEESSNGLWKPPGADDEVQEEQGGDLWQPPGADQENDDSGFSWKPPTGGEAEDSFDFSASANTANSWEPTLSNGLKRKREEDSDGFHADSGAAAADAFYSKLTRSLDTRADSRLYHMRAFNGWVKATQIQELDPKTKRSDQKTDNALRVLDLACGKGGDLGKWILHPRGVSNYVGIDVARGSLKDAAIRVRNMRQKLKRCTFTCADLGADVPGRLKSPRHKYMQKLLTWSLQNESDYETGDPEFKMIRGGGISKGDKFDVVSIQFAIHYMMSSRKRARRFFQTVSELLEVGGNLIATTIDARVVLEHMMNLGLDLHFDDPTHQEEEAVISVGNGACRIRFAPDIVKRIFTGKDNVDENSLFGLEYSFTLVEGSDHAAGVGDAVNLPEWLTPLPALESLALESGLELIYAQNFHEFFATRGDPATYAAAHGSLYNMKVLNRNGSVYADEWEISRLYAALKFRKVRESSMTMEDSDEEEAEDDLLEIDPALKSKLLPMAMMKAKKDVGDDAWKSMSSEEKTMLTDVQLRKLASSKS